MSVNEWDTKGCPVCRQLWRQGDYPEKLVNSVERHCILHRCNECGTYWEQNERFADTISEEDVMKFYSDLLNESSDV